VITRTARCLQQEIATATYRTVPTRNTAVFLYSFGEVRNRSDPAWKAKAQDYTSRVLPVEPKATQRASPPAIQRWLGEGRPR
jgi:hypothetical protein